MADADMTEAAGEAGPDPDPLPEPQRADVEMTGETAPPQKAAKRFAGMMSWVLRDRPAALGVPVPATAEPPATAPVTADPEAATPVPLDPAGAAPAAPADAAPVIAAAGTQAVQKFSEEMKMEAEATLIKKPIRHSRPPLLLTEVHERINKVSQSVAMTCMAV